MPPKPTVNRTRRFTPSRWRAYVRRAGYHINAFVGLDFPPSPICPVPAFDDCSDVHPSWSRTKRPDARAHQLMAVPSVGTGGGPVVAVPSTLLEQESQGRVLT